MSAVLYPEIHKHVEKLPSSDANNNRVCTINQKQALWKVLNHCGPQAVAESNPAHNFIVRAAAMSLSDEYRDSLNALTDTRISNRQNVDSHCSDKKPFSKGLLC